MQCNIDAKGKRLRLIGGLLTLTIGMVMAILSLITVLPGGWFWLLNAAVLLGGVFQIYEARAGWCALRALGLRTPI